MENVILEGKGIGDKTFDIEHAQRILDIKTPPKAWKLKDPAYELVAGKITKKAAQAQSPEPAPTHN